MSWATFSKANEIMNYLKTHLSPARAEKLDRLDIPVSSIAPADTALSNQIWTDSRASLLDLMDPIMSNLGTDSDPPDPLGSVHAKIKDIKETVYKGGSSDYVFYTPSIYATNITGTTQNEWVTIREINGAGFVTEALLWHTGTTITNSIIHASGYRITVDDTIVMEGNFAGSGYEGSQVRTITIYPSGLTLLNLVVNNNSVVMSKSTFFSRMVHRRFSNIGGSIGLLDSITTHELTTIKSFPSIEDHLVYNPGVAILHNPVVFNSNFKIEVYCMSSDPIHIQNCVYFV